ncbi:prenyltransferase/squalene oxidase repeat-containing protein [Streptomyces sp. V4-01]|uniref:Prenyltransferase/squalene oxidase repeat-containing protein n=1 Tax=Actinacidiphila polyblastidii TaxID=3110430 RepID=A0ABU7PJZ9_9ACTN|nr:prenyltransferase/squalene oxidase repeat-containing protein [Streptomyces sp. V4-01]
MLRTAQRRRPRRPRVLALFTAGALAVAGTAAGLLPIAAAAHADPLDACTATSGAVVAVDYGHWHGPVLRGCDAHPTTGLDLLHTAGFTTTGTVHDGSGFICRIGNAGFDGGAAYPTAADEGCVLTPPAGAYWSYWIAPAGQDTWTYSPLGAPSDHPGDGEVEAWVFGPTDLGGSTGGPSFTPASVRAQSAPTTPPSTGPAGTPPTPPGGGASADLPAAARWLSGRLTDGDHVFDGSATDYAATANTAVALAAAGGPAATVRAIDAYLTAHARDYLLPDPTVDVPAPAAAANLALLTEILGGDPTATAGRNLLADLTDHVCDAAGSLGNCTAAGDFYGVFSPDTQARALLALARGGATVPQAAIDRLTGMQCADGGFSGSMLAAGEKCASDPATTADAVLALHRLSGDAASGTGPYAAALATAQTYLLKQQSDDGGHVAHDGAPAGDTATTAAAAEALSVLGRTGEAAAARSWLAARQTADGGFASDGSAGGAADLHASTAALPAAAGADPGSLRYDDGATTAPTTPPTTGPSTPRSTGPGTGPTTPGGGSAGASPDLAKAVSYLIDRGNLVDGHSYESTPGGHTGFADFGLTIDGVFALAATGGADDTLAGVSDFLQHGKDGTGRGIDDWTLIGSAYAQGGSLAKEAVAAEVLGADPRSYGGHDLIAALDGTLCTKADASGGCAARGGYAYATSVFSQSLGVIAQLRAGDTANAAGPVGYLESLQNADGSWPSLIPGSNDGDVDSTAMAMMALDLVPGDAAAEAVGKGAAWIAGAQLADGGFHGAAGDSVNSAALAVQGLSLDAGAHPAQIAKARAFLAHEQNGDGGFRVASDSDDTRSDLRASTQATGGATGASFGTLLRDLTDQKAAAAGSAYLVKQLAGGDHLSNAYGPDYGLSADLAFALAATGGQDKPLTKVTGYLAGHVADYADPAGTSAYPGPYSGADAKLALLAEAMGQDPHHFGGFDLITTLTGHVCTAATDDGACTAAGDFSQAYSTVSQSLGVLALSRAGATVPPAAVKRLLQLQCADGGFSSTLVTAAADCTSDVDTTGYALQALTLAPGHADQVAAARGYLLKAQQKNGGYQGAAGVSSNSTALAVQALLATDRVRPEQARDGQAFLRSAQNTDGGFRITGAAGDSDLRSSTQAVPALAGTPLTTLTHALAPISPSGGNPPSGGAGSSGAGSSAGGSSGGDAGSTENGSSPGGSLAATGTTALTAAAAAAALLAAGGVLLAARRRAATHGRHQ